MSSAFIAAKCFTVATRSSGVLAVVGAMSFGLPALDTIHRIDRTRLAFELINGARLSDACGRDCGGESGTEEMTALHKGALFF